MCCEVLVIFLPPSICRENRIGIFYQSLGEIQSSSIGEWYYHTLCYLNGSLGDLNVIYSTFLLCTAHEITWWLHKILCGENWSLSASGKTHCTPWTDGHIFTGISQRQAISHTPTENLEPLLHPKRMLLNCDKKLVYLEKNPASAQRENISSCYVSARLSYCEANVNPCSTIPLCIKQLGLVEFTLISMHYQLRNVHTATPLQRHFVCWFGRIGEDFGVLCCII